MQAPVPKGYNTVNPFLFAKDALRLIEFLTEVFEAEEDMAGHTIDTDGLLLHSEILIGSSRVMIAERKPRWPSALSFLQVYVDNVETVLARAERLGASIVTRPTEFFGDLFSRFLDPWGNLWWVYQHNPGPSEAVEPQDDFTDSGDQSWEPTKEMVYIHETLLEVMEELGSRRPT